jgi:hypothetical protein
MNNAAGLPDRTLAVAASLALARFGSLETH